jgi:hypothetical protein
MCVLILYACTYGLYLLLVLFIISYVFCWGKYFTSGVEILSGVVNYILYIGVLWVDIHTYTYL